MVELSRCRACTASVFFRVVLSYFFPVVPLSSVQALLHSVEISSLVRRDCSYNNGRHVVHSRITALLPPRPTTRARRFRLPPSSTAHKPNKASQFRVHALREGRRTMSEYGGLPFVLIVSIKLGCCCSPCAPGAPAAAGG